MLNQKSYKIYVL